MAAAPFFIQPARKTDISSLVELEKMVFLASDGIINERQFKYHYRSSNLLYVAKSTSQTTECLGYILVLTRRKSARLYSMATAPSSENIGVAKALISHTLEKIRIRNIKKITLEVRKGNHKARKLYKSFGFREHCILYNYYGNEEDAIAMVRDSTPLTL